MNAGVKRWTIGIQPEARLTQLRLNVGLAQSPKPNVMALSRTIIDRSLKADILSTAKKIKGTKGSGRVRDI
jgi:hypothetical protein